MSKVMLIAARSKHIPIVDNCDYIGIDRGALIAIRQGLRLKCAIGDFDSVNEVERKEIERATIVHSMPARKDDTDSEAALHYALQQGYDDIILYGCFGGRIDHAMANMYLLMHRDYPLTLMDEHNTAKILKQGNYHIANTHKYLSFLALEDSIISERGVSYPLIEKDISPDIILTISNEIIDDEAIIDIHKGKVLMMQCDEQ